MKEISLSAAQKLCSPNPFALVGTKAPDGKENFMAASWWTFMSNSPPLIGVCLGEKGYTGKVIESTGEFTISVVSDAIKDQALAYGQSSGNKIDKLEKFPIEVIKANVVNAPVPAESRICFECKLKAVYPAGNHKLYMGDIVSVSADESKNQLYAYDGYGRLGLAGEIK